MFGSVVPLVSVYPGQEHLLVALHIRCYNEELPKKLDVLVTDFYGIVLGEELELIQKGLSGTLVRESTLEDVLIELGLPCSHIHIRLLLYVHALQLLFD